MPSFNRKGDFLTVSAGRNRLEVARVRFEDGTAGQLEVRTKGGFWRPVQLVGAAANRYVLEDLLVSYAELVEWVIRQPAEDPPAPLTFPRPAKTYGED